MTKQSTVEVGNATILLVSANDPFIDGRTTGYLEFYDERHRLTFPLTSHMICEYLEAIIQEPSMPALWKAGRITGWIEALIENAPQTFRSFVLSEHRAILQEM